MGSGLPGSPPSYLLFFHLLLYMSYLSNKIVVVVVVHEHGTGRPT